MEPWPRVRTLDRSPQPRSLRQDSISKEATGMVQDSTLQQRNNIPKFLRAGGSSQNKHWPCRVVKKIKTVVKDQGLIGLSPRGVARAHQHIKSEFASLWV